MAWKGNSMDKKELITPCYIIHEELLEEGIALLNNALKQYWNNYICGYSFKTNSLPWVVEKMKRENFYAEVVSEDEYFLAKRFGYKKIIYNGPVKGKKSFMEALEKGHIINLDAARELTWLEEWKADHEDKTPCIGVRVNFNLEEIVPNETSAGEEGSRFGFSYEKGEFKAVLDKLQALSISVSGLHLHTSSKTRSLAIYRALARKACQLKEEFNLSLSFLDMGGGYFGGMDNRPKFPDYVKVMEEELKTSFSPKETTLILEPGTSLITPPIEYLTEVIDVKSTYANNIVTIDGSRIDVDPLHTKSNYFYKLQCGQGQPAERELVEKQVICGLTCMENDRLFIADNEKRILPGDRISFQKVGGYTMCLTPLFIRYFPNVYVERSGKYELVRKAWGAEEYCQKIVGKEDSL